MDQALIRHKVLREGASIRQGAHELGISRNTVSKYLEQSAPVRRTYPRRARPVWARVQPRLEELVAEWEPRTTAKQRLTGVRLHRALREEGYCPDDSLLGRHDVVCHLFKLAAEEGWHDSGLGFDFLQP